MDYLVSNKVSGFKSSWRMGSCSTGTSQTGSFTNTADNKFKKWDDRFSKRRIKCKGSQDIKFLKVFDICNNGASEIIALIIIHKSIKILEFTKMVLRKDGSKYERWCKKNIFTFKFIK